MAMIELIGGAALLSSRTGSGTNCQANIQPGSDIVMNDLRWPVWDAGMYCCLVHEQFNLNTLHCTAVLRRTAPTRQLECSSSCWCVTEAVYYTWVHLRMYAKGQGWDI